MTTLYFLDVPENTGIIDVAEKDSALQIDRVGPYYAIKGDGTILIDRRATDCRHAVWYSAVAGVSGGTIAQWDKDALRVESSPTDAAEGAKADRSKQEFETAGLPA